MAFSFKEALQSASPQFDVFFAPDKLRLGGFWLPQLDTAISRSDAFIILVGRGLGEWQKIEYFEALNRHVASLKAGGTPYPLIPVFTADTAPTLPFIQNIQWLRTRAPSDQATIQSICAALLDGDTLPKGDAAEVINPYRGLLSMEEQDAAFFFGRDEEIAASMDSVLSSRRALTMLIGNSGVGKSSLVHAGLLPRLRTREPDPQVRSAPKWSYSTLRPGRRPFRAVALALARHWLIDPTDPTRSERVAAWERSLQGGLSLPELIDATEEHLERLGYDRPARYLLYFDQFEELFSNDHDTVDRFSRCISNAIDDKRLSITASMRADYYGSFQSLHDLFQRSRRIDIRPFDKDGLRLILTEPARRLGVSMDDEAALDQIIDGTHEQPAALPLLVDLMTDVWRSMQDRGDRVLRLRGQKEDLVYASTLASRADRLLAEFPDIRDQVKRVFTFRLIHVPDRGLPFRVKAYNGECSEAEWKLIQTLAEPDWRLVVTGVEDDERVSAEIAHDILLSRWPALQQWIEEERSFLVWKGNAQFQLERWREVSAEEKESALLLGISLGQSEVWLRDRRDDLSAPLVDYILKSLEAREAATQEEEEARQTQKFAVIGQLAGGVAHDFNNVLTAIIGFTDLLMLRHQQGDPSYPDLMSIRSSANRAAGLTRQLVAYARQQALRPQAMEVPAHLDDLVVLLQRLIGEQISLKVEHGPNAWSVRVDLVQLEQVVVNLVVNARDAMPNGGTIALRTRNIDEQEARNFSHSGMPAAEYVLIEVEDTGTGIPPEVVENIFEPFFSTKELGKGTGLGLSTVHGIVKQSAGFIYPESVVGKGTTFRVFLPRYVPGEDELPPKKLTGPTMDLRGDERILLVEDEASVRAFSARALRAQGYNVFEAESGYGALSMLEDHTHKFDLMVSNVVMPEMDGAVLLTKARELRPDLRVILMSGYAEESIRQDIANDITIEFLPKPFSIDQLASKVRQTLDDQA